MSIAESRLRQIVHDVVHEETRGPERARGSSDTIDRKQIVDHVASCPACYRESLDKLNRESEYFCASCGLPLGSEAMVKALDDCPSCHKKEPMKRKR